MFSVAIHKSVSCPNCYVKSSSRCFYDPDNMQVGKNRLYDASATQLSDS